MSAPGRGTDLLPERATHRLGLAGHLAHILERLLVREVPQSTRKCPVRRAQLGDADLLSEGVGQLSLGGLQLSEGGAAMWCQLEQLRRR